MTGLVFGGIFGIGFVFGYLLYYAVRHTKEFSIEMLSVAIGAVSSATIIGQNTPLRALNGGVAR
jgi:hypothetical protein